VRREWDPGLKIRDLVELQNVILDRTTSLQKPPSTFAGSSAVVEFKNHSFLTVVTKLL